MTSYRYHVPGESGEDLVYTLTEREILNNYFPVWVRLMWRAGKEKLISPKNCLEDWITIHYAERINDGTE